MVKPGSRIPEFISSFFPEFAFIFSWLGLSIFSIIVSGKFIYEIVPNKPEEILIFTVKKIEVFLWDLLIGSAFFILVLIIVGQVYEQTIQEKTLYIFGFDLYQFDSLVFFSSIHSLAAVFVSFLIGQIIYYFRNRPARERDRRIMELGSNEENYNGS